MWGGTRKVVILGSLPQRLAAEPPAGEAPDVTAARRAVLASLIDKRTSDKDERFIIEVRHIGTPEDPLRFEQLEADHAAKAHAARVRARKLVESEGGSIADDEAINAALARDSAWSSDLGKLMVAWIDAGVVGAGQAARIWELGERCYGAGGGGSLLIDAATEVKRFQYVTEDEGKG